MKGHFASSQHRSKPTTQSNQTISPLRQRMIDDMTLRKLSPKTQTAYIRSVKNLSCFLERSPRTASAGDLRRYQLHLVEQEVSSGCLNATITGLQFFLRSLSDAPKQCRR